VSFSTELKKSSIVLYGDFSYGTEYTVEILEGITSKSGNLKTVKSFHKVIINDLNPEIKYTDRGIFLPSKNNGKIGFTAVNVSNVTLKITKIFENNITFFLQYVNFTGEENANFYFENARTGEEVYESKINLNRIKNKKEYFEVDIADHLKKYDEGIFVVEIFYNDYYGQRQTLGGQRGHGRILKPVVISDIALAAKVTEKGTVVYARDIKTSNAVRNVTVTLYSFNNQVIEKAKTDRDGKVIFKSDKGFYITGETSTSKAILKFSDSIIDTSSFDIAGSETNADKTRAFIYTDRDVYRPGDDIFITAIFRHSNNTFPQNHPVKCEFFDVDSKNIHTQTKRDGVEGVYSFKLSTAKNSKTGNYRVKLTAGPDEFHHNIRVETIIPDRLKVDVLTSKNKYSKNENIVFNINSEYLTGAKASNLKSQIGIYYQNQRKTFSDYRNFNFNDEATAFFNVEPEFFDFTLDKNGNHSFELVPAEFSKIPGGISISANVKVFETGGRAAESVKKVEYDIYDYFAGINIENKYSFKTDEDVNIEFVVVDNHGKAASGRNLKYTIYRQHTWWWWDYNDETSFRQNYRQSNTVEIISENELVSTDKPMEITFKPSEWGQYFIELSDIDGGHTSGVFFSAYSWGDTSNKREQVLETGTDKNQYKSDETATVTFKTPANGKIWVTVEKGRNILFETWVNVNSENTSIKIPLTSEMVPAVQISGLYIQGTGAKNNDVPIRLFGMKTIEVDNENTRIKPVITVDEIKPNSSFKVNIDTEIESVLTVTVTDIGLLSITNYKNPDPWPFFYNRLSHNVTTHDMSYDILVPSILKPVSVFKTGGSDEGDYREKRLLSSQADRFDIVSLFSEVVKTDSNGKAELEFEMPNYTGRVRVSAVASKNEKYGNSFKDVIVKDNIMVFSSFPRVLTLGDKFSVPVKVFSGNHNVSGKTEISLKINGGLKSLSGEKFEVNLTSLGENTVWIDFEVENKIGIVDISIKATCNKESFTEKIQIDVKPPLPYISGEKNFVLNPGERQVINVDKFGIPGS
jgi:uncharacterized protein YfaS (alpha-2-macroglobulin family)